MVGIVGNFTGAKKEKDFHGIAKNAFDVMKVLVKEAEEYIENNTRLRLPTPHILDGIQLRSDRDGSTYLGVVFKYSNALTENDFYRLWTNYMKALGNGRII